MQAAILALALGAASANEWQKIVDVVASKNATWTSSVPARFGSVDDVKKLCGTWIQGHEKFTATEGLATYEANPYIEQVMADSLDWRTAAPQCTVISKIRDQSSCGSCWAFGSTETFEDRRCIATGEDIEFSTADTAGCCSGLLCGLSQGCGGGQPTSALKWMARTGVVTGGDYGDIDSGSSCMPYQFQPCAHHVDPTPEFPVCPEAEYKAQCVSTCTESKYAKAYKDDKHAEGTAKTVTSVAAMLTALQKGPLSAAFTVYADFPTYTSGVYKHTTGSALGGHAVEIIGYGNEDGEDYWLVKNSWNNQWGLGGTFKIARGNDECGMESSVAAIDF